MTDSDEPCCPCPLGARPARPAEEEVGRLDEHAVDRRRGRCGGRTGVRGGPCHGTIFAKLPRWGQGFPTGSFNPNDVPGGNFPGGPGGGNASMTISGTVKSIDGTRMTITTANGTDTVIDTSGSSYHAESPATAADVKAGSTVSVSVSGLGGFRPGASGAPVASAGTSSAIKATDVTLTGAR